MSKVLLSLLIATAAAFGQEFRLEKAGAPPSELAAPIREGLEAEGAKIVKGDGSVFCEIWFRKEAPGGANRNDISVSWKTVPLGAIVGAIRFPNDGEDRRGQGLKGGVYTLRFNLHPVDGSHQGVEPTRDFLVLSPAADDQNPKPIENFDELIKLSKKASGTQHPAVMAVWKVDGDFQPGLSQLGEKDWVLSKKVGDVQLSMIVFGRNEG